jgi:DNA-binding transcriptional MocR family regulator
MRSVLRERLADYLELLREHLPDGSSIIPPEGGCLLWIGLPKGSDASRLFELCAAEDILVAPGELFSANPHFRGHFRVNYGNLLDEPRRKELMRICELAKEV